MQNESTATKIPDLKTVLSMIDKIFLLPLKTKKDLKETFPKMDETKKQDFFVYISEILQKQDEILSFLIKNNPNFISELKAFNVSNKKTTLKNIEGKLKEKDGEDMNALEESLKTL